MCGYASYIAEAGAGVLLSEPFSHDAFVEQLTRLLLDQDRRSALSASGRAFGRGADIFDLPERATALIVAAAQSLGEEHLP